MGAWEQQASTDILPDVHVGQTVYADKMRWLQVVLSRNTLDAVMSLFNPWVILCVVAALIGAYFYGDHQGAARRDAAWLKRENVELVATNAKIIEITAKNREIEQKAAKDVNDVAIKFQKEITNVSTRKDRVIADLRSGALKLRGTASCQEASRDSGPATAASASRGSAETGSNLLEESDLEYLVAEAGRADQVTLQLGACQAILVRDREAINR